MHAAQSLSGEYLTVFHDAKRLALSGSAAGRLARLLLDWGRASASGKPEIRFTMALTHEEIANMAGTSRETVTRLLNQFRRDEWITVKGSSLTIIKPDQLERLSWSISAPGPGMTDGTFFILEGLGVLRLWRLP
jgi:CRP/FNR family transcriptional regulator